MSEKTQLSQTSQQFGYLEYSLQLSLHSPTARITAAYALSNPHLTIQFERKCKNMLTLDTWVDPSQLQGINSEEEIIRRGFQFNMPNPGIKFTVGSLKPMSKGLKERTNLPASPGAAYALPGSDSSSRTLRKALLCRLGIGRAFVTDESSCATEKLPEGYDSFYVRATEGTKKTRIDGYRHEYYITDPAQILPQYVVVYDYDPVREKKSREKACCDNCEQAEASVYCSADHARLCRECDVSLHSGNKLTSRHIRTPIGKGADVFGFCRTHPDKQIEFFCSQCHIPVCVYCKMVGHHSNGDAAKHKLVSVSEAYQSVVTESQMPDPIIQARLTAIHSQMASISSRARSVEKHAAQVEAQIEEIYRKALTELRTITKHKLDILLGDECELIRELGEINRLDEFLRYQQGGDATHFLFSWARHQQLCAELHDFKFFRDAIDVQLDMKCTGTINIVVDETVLPSQKPRSPTKAAVGGYLSPAGHAIGAGLPSKLLQGGSTGRKTHRRTSDFFTETLGALEDISFAQDTVQAPRADEEDADVYSTGSAAVYDSD